MCFSDTLVGKAHPWNSKEMNFGFISIVFVCFSGLYPKVPFLTVESNSPENCLKSKKQYFKEYLYI